MGYFLLRVLLKCMLSCFEHYLCLFRIFSLKEKQLLFPKTILSIDNAGNTHYHNIIYQLQKLKYVCHTYKSHNHEKTIHHYHFPVSHFL
jgi:hypothetical protein